MLFYKTNIITKSNLSTHINVWFPGINEELFTWNLHIYRMSNINSGKSLFNSIHWLYILY